MKKVYLILAAAVGMTITSCTTNDYLGDVNNDQAINDGSIKFGLGFQNMTRADIAATDITGADAAKKLGNYFYVIGTKGTEGATNPTPDLVFDNYLVKFTANTAGTTASNTANWEYVGLQPGTSPDDYYAYLTSMTPARATAPQTIKYWDYSAAKYHFHAFSTGLKKPVSGTPANDNEIGVTASKYGAGLASSATAYTFDIRNVEGLENVYITDITTVAQGAAYGKDVTLKFKNLGSKIRIALYETVPGYSIKAGSVKFWNNATTPLTTADPALVPTTTGTLISTDVNGMPKKGTIAVYFPNVGTNNTNKVNYNKASVNVTADVSDNAYKEFYKEFGTISDPDKMVVAQGKEEAGKIYLGRSLPEASFVGDKNKDYYTLAFPVDDSHPLTLRVNYTLTSTDGSGEEINVYGATAVVPSTYTKWQPNYAYTYIFKISDNTNGYTDVAQTKAGLFPITFDAVVADFTEVSGEQTTITTVATPSITTYQQFHDITKNEYSMTVKNQKDENVTKDIYVLVKKGDNSLASDLNTNTTEDTPKSMLFAIAAGTTEAEVVDALEQRTTEIDDVDVIKGRNGLTLTKSDKLSNTATTIENGADDNPITKIYDDDIAAGQVAKIDKTLATGTYAYVYDWTTGSKAEKAEFQPVAVTLTPSALAIGESTKEYYTLVNTALNSAPAITLSADEPVSRDYLYFSKTTTDGGTSWTYSYISVAGKTTMPKGVIKYPKASVTAHVPGTTLAAENTFYFDKFYSNVGQYAVKVIIVE